jgi:asparagine synthetase B (glutamine-hydrolysing)
VPLVDKLKQKGKGPLKEILNGYGGQAFSRRKKMGFGLPMADFMRQKEYPLWSIIMNDDPIFEFVREEAVGKMKKEHLAGKTDWNMQLWSILVLSHWLKRNSG